MITFAQARDIALNAVKADWSSMLGGTPAASFEGSESANYYAIEIGDSRWIVDKDESFLDIDDIYHIVEKSTGKYSEVSRWWLESQGIVLKELSDTTKAIKPELTIEPTAGVPSSLEVARALSRLEILPNPDDPAIGNIEKFVESPWETVPTPSVNPNVWDEAKVTLLKLADLFGTDPYLRRKTVRKRIEVMGQALTPRRSYALVINIAGKNIIIDGHHRLMALWLLGLDEAPVWLVKE